MYKTKVIADLNADQKTTSEDIIAAQMNAASLQIEECLDNLGSFADIVSIEHFETYSIIAENQHIYFTTQFYEKPGNYIQGDFSSCRIEDYNYNELTKLNVSENE